MWKKLPCNQADLQLTGTLNGGQSFRWKKATEDCIDVWIGVFKDRVWFLKQDSNFIQYQVHNSVDKMTKGKSNTKKKKPLQNGNEPGLDNEETMLRKYFRLDVDISGHYKDWSLKDKYFKEAATKFYGIRMLDQDPVENLFSFICSQNNHITRISSMVEKLCEMYGKPICDINDTTYYAFPTVESLAEENVESDLRQAGFGYRARYISESAKKITKLGGSQWFDKLKQMDYPLAKAELCQLTGIGAKVADCICLMSLGHLEAIPVDTHVFQIATCCYLPHLSKYKTVTDKVYAEISQHFQNLFGPLAGWAHTVLFCADLKKLRESTDESTDTAKEKKRKKLKRA